MEHITCNCPVLGTWQIGLIVLHDGRPRPVGKSQIHQNLYPTSTERLDKRHLLRVRRDHGGEHAGGGLDLYRPVDFDRKVA